MRWHLLSSRDSIINGKRFIQALLAIWAMGKVIPHLAYKTEWSVLWTSHALQCLLTALRKNKAALTSCCILAEFILHPWCLQSSFACADQLLVICDWFSELALSVSSFSYCSLYSTHLYLTQRPLAQGCHYKAAMASVPHIIEWFTIEDAICVWAMHNVWLIKHKNKCVRTKMHLY